MSFTLSQHASQQKKSIVESAHEHLYPGRIEKFHGGGIDLVPGKREGYRLWDVDGRELLDLHLNGGTFNLGHRNPDLIQTLNKASADWDIGNHHFPSEPKAKLAQALINATPGDMKYVVLTTSGSEANDVAVKSARFATGRRKIVALEMAYHGRTGFSGAAGDDENALYFDSAYPEEFIKVPFNDLTAMEKALAGRDVALVMMETLPATFGFPVPHDDYLPGVKQLCEKYGTLYLADEVQTGLGRTGKPWAVDLWNVKPDMLVTGKGLSGGVYPIAALVLSQDAGKWLELDGNPWGHVSTFGGSDLGCIVALQALDMSISKDTLANVQTHAKYLRAGLEALKSRFPFFESIRQQGLVMGLKFSDPMMGTGMMRAFFENGIWAIAAGFDQSVVQFKPGLLIDKAYCDELLARVENSLIWLVNNINSLITGDEPDEDAPHMQAIRALVLRGLKQWGIQDAEVKLLKHRENSVFKVTLKDGTNYAFRVHREDYHNKAELLSEITWMKALNESGIPTPAILPAQNGEMVVSVTHPDVTAPRLCTILEWVEGTLFDDLGRVEKGMQKELEERYFKLGGIAGKLHNQSANWQIPEGFVRHAWDKEGLLGETPFWGRFWEHPVVTPEQCNLMGKARIVLSGMLDQLGKGRDVYGLIHADFLPENVLVDGDKLNLIDFDDCGYGYFLFEMATSLFPHINQPFFDELTDAYVKGYRTERTLSDEHVELLPAFIMLRGFTYLGWLESRRDSMKNADLLAKEIATGISEFIPELLGHLTKPQRIGVEIYHFLNPMIKRITRKKH
jgi:acetylornithine/succinyldiaminopimelate/putrescine aminotransferase/Ser/Thr protein kinase RdoA (MazF antagonist)